MEINTDKTKVRLITSRQKRYNLKNSLSLTSRQKRYNLKNSLSLNFKDADLKLTSNEKVLGLHIDEHLLWNGHFQYTSKKISSFMASITNKIKFLSIEDKLFYNVYIRPHIDN